VLEDLATNNILGGLDLSKDYPELGNTLLVCATETKTDADLALYAAALENVLHDSQAKSA
jgi:glycine dehydrogenase subunit 1